MWVETELVKCIDGSNILISNDYELELIVSKTGLDKKSLLQLTGAIITTLGEVGSRISAGKSEIEIPAAKPNEVKDPTGAGDAYRAGLIKGLVQNLDIKQSAEMGTVCATYAVECYGTQEHHFSLPEFEKRLADYRS